MATRAPDTLTPAGAWAAHALCRFDDPKLYFTDSGTGAALATCRTCPVRVQCLDMAMAAEGDRSAGSRFGIFGGLTPEERAARAAATPEVVPAAPVQPRWRGHELAPCGTRAAYRRHQRRGETPCRACKAAESLARTERSARQKTAAA